MFYSGGSGTTGARKNSNKIASNHHHLLGPADDYDVTDYSSSQRHVRDNDYYDNYAYSNNSPPMDVAMGYGRTPATKLPPLQSSISKKKKKKTQISAQEDDGGLYLNPDDAVYFN